jgi:tripartite-type tricarboxylate transporter receptor subunit TctC
MSNSIPSLQAKKAKAIAVTGDKRLEMLPQTATFKEQGVPQVDVDFWYGFLAPANTPAPIVARLHAEISEVMKDPEIINRYKAQGIDVMSSTPQAFGRLVARETAEWAQLINKAGIKAD